ncbi:MAG: ribosome-associated protein [Tenuifilum sp.]|jgi:ribosome-associated protein|uniref:RNA-binding S4 domain-containing protein n=1 Tax=Tenuifilum sp. TaxID=2760880 RepID=UPI0024AB7771|nr:RNA-binding S4 domain-containing protein [Tenuifilum sp.]MDI3526370.1 ribosome-associated protein [Tenuifilum sp.]
MDYKLETEYIQLDKLLKDCKIASSGGEAHQMVLDGIVKLNGKIESRKRAKIRVGDTIEVIGIKINIV